MVHVRPRELLKIIQGAGTQPLDVVSADCMMHEALCQLLSPNVVIDRQNMNAPRFITCALLFLL